MQNNILDQHHLDFYTKKIASDNIQDATQMSHDPQKNEATKDILPTKKVCFTVLTITYS
jgi:hypothetical protein